MTTHLYKVNYSRNNSDGEKCTPFEFVAYFVYYLSMNVPRYGQWEKNKVQEVLSGK